ncbi:uncharacterized protein LOC108628043 [Ceratina calcarata]|uniref:Uncharacterized protein LOC108628043 n=1 Tax=Ceratina calcarata TaxID=156304 RepID=A0AAJ7J5E8_9HYME|nr:uncharacterized protein LOC108628043 [Ceratina calcarata]XP_017885190.1 uncharacterized protein LOC108628043 [Ceratina calcarata]
MGSYTEFTDILRDVVQFLECLREVKLPVNLESIRDNLLIRSKVTLKTFVVDKTGRGVSPEPYLNMSAGSKGLISLETETELQEYVGAGEHCQMQKEHKESQQDYYETFQGIEPPNNTDNNQSKDEETENMLINTYSSFSAVLAKSKCQICGSLYRKEGKKLFVFEQYRACWVALIGSHLLIYGNDRDNRPYTILPIRGYSARAAPNAIPRDQRRSESTFEIFRPGSRTYQFSAKTQKEMEQWITRICELAGEDNNEQKKSVDNVITSNDTQLNNQEDSNCTEEQYQDVGSLSVEKVPNEPSTVHVNENVPNQTDSKDPINTSLPSSSPISDTGIVPFPSRPHPGRSHAPPLPARIPRRLPSLPVQKSSYQFPEEDEDDIYHKIEDFRNVTTQYENVGVAKTNEPETYDDVQASIKTDKSDDKKKNDAKRTSIDSSNEITYDDTGNTVLNRVDEQDQLASYDDVESVKEKSNKIQTPSKTDEPVKSPQKRSFLDRVRSRRESPKKVEKKSKRKTAQPSVVENQDPQPLYYDDVSDLVSVHQETCLDEEQPEYTSPPPPRPIYTKPPVITDTTDGHEFYDDVAALREKSKNPDQKVSRKLNYEDPVHANVNRLVNETTDNSRMEDNEHYKTPRIDYPQCLPELENELYDDIAILAEFTVRQKEVLGKKDVEGVNNNSEKRPWNRFVSGRKSKPADVIVETNNKIVNGVEDSVDNLEQHGPTRMNTFQKLISRMESLGKASARTGSSMLSTNKTNLTNNA